jgi:hypothetical protein
MKLAALLTLLLLTACTGAAPEGPAPDPKDNTARPCDLPTVAEYCPDCTITASVDENGQDVEVLGHSDAIGEDYVQVFDEAGDVVYWQQSGGVVFGCADGVIVFVRNPVAGILLCWTTSGEKYECVGREPAEWRRSVETAKARASR